MMEFARSGAATALYWSPQRSDTAACAGCLWSADTGGRPPCSTCCRSSPGGSPSAPSWSVSPPQPASVRVLAQRRHLVVVNTAAAPVDATVDGRTAAARRA